MANEFYITAGLPALDSAGTPAVDDISRFYITAGLTANDYPAPAGATIPARRRSTVIPITISSLFPTWFLAACLINPKLTRRDWLRPWRWLSK